MEITVIDTGLVKFAQGYALQQEIFQEVKAGLRGPVLVLCRHYPVITAGRKFKEGNLLVRQEELAIHGIELHHIERGGDLTYHGPGQLTAYPILDLNFLKKDIHWYLRKLEEVVLNFLSDFGVLGRQIPGFTGVWVQKRKIASIGIAIRNWVTFHGLSININNFDLPHFRMIKPCGMDIEMTCLEDLSGRNLQINQLKESLVRHFRSVFCTETIDKSSVDAVGSQGAVTSIF